MRKLKKIISLISVFLMMFYLMACNKVILKSGDELISKPKYSDSIIYGVWKVDSVMIVDQKLAGSKPTIMYSDVSISFSNSMAVIGDNTLMNPNFKFKVYYSKHDLLYQYNIDVSKLSVDTSKPIKTVLVYQNNSIFCEAIIKNENEMYIYQNGVIYDVHKISDMDTKIEIIEHNNVIKDKVDDSTNVYSTDTPTGVLIGLKGDRVKEKNGEYKQDYRTLWISFEDGAITNVLSKKDIFMPRLKGFSLVSVNQHIKVNGDIQEYMTVKNINPSLDKEKSSTDDKKHVNDRYYYFNGSNKNKLIDLLFLSNNYFSVEYTEEYDLKNNHQSYSILRTLPIDDPNNSVGLSIDSLGEGAVDSYNKTVEALKKRDNKGYIGNLQSFGIMRQNGYWSIKARTNVDKDYIEFDLNCLPTKEIISYDKLSVPWSTIKERVPNALDAITSPNGNIAIIRTYDSLEIYKIENKLLENHPIKIINLNKGESIIMDEWCMNEFVGSWEKAFVSYGDYEDVVSDKGSIK